MFRISLLIFAFLTMTFSLRVFADPIVTAISTISTLEFVNSVPLANKTYPTYHPQGVKVLGNDLYLSTVQGTLTGYGHIVKFQLDSAQAPRIATPISRLTFDRGPKKRMIHPGGVDFDGDDLLVPLAEYDSSGPGAIMRVDLKNFGAYSTVNTIKDHIGAIVRDAEAIYVMNWDSKKTYAFDGVSALPIAGAKGTGWNYQDCKQVVRGYALCSALQGKIVRKGEIHLLRFAQESPFGVSIAHRIKVEKYNSDGSKGGSRPLTNNAMDFSIISNVKTGEATGLRFYFVPHDDSKTQLMIFDAHF